MKKPKVAFVIGHHRVAKGAYSYVLNVSEYSLWNEFYDNYLCDVGDKFVHDTSKGYLNRQNKMSVKTKDYDLVFELHFNSAGSTQAHGAEALVYYTNKKMAQVGQYFCELMSRDLCYRNRDVKLISGGNGFGFLQKTKGSAIILEPFFGSNEADCHRFDMSKYREIIIETIKYYGEI